MIEIIWKDYVNHDYDLMMYASSFMTWLAVTLTEEKNHEIEFNGYLIVKEKEKGCSILVISGNPESQKRILQILQQPPEEYKEKYIARVPCDEPDPVNEQTDKDINEEVKDET